MIPQLIAGHKGLSFVARAFVSETDQAKSSEQARAAVTLNHSRRKLAVRVTMQMREERGESQMEREWRIQTKD